MLLTVEPGDLGNAQAAKLTSQTSPEQDFDLATDILQQYRSERIERLGFFWCLAS